MTTEIDTGDTILHHPTGEQWLVAGVKGDRLMWCGYPEGTAALADCELVEKATPERRDALLRTLAESSPMDMRSRYARERLASQEAA